MNRPTLSDTPATLPCTLATEQARGFIERNFHALQDQIDGVRNEDMEAIQDMRVASRRPRAALAEFKQYFEPAAAPLSDSLSALCAEADRKVASLVDDVDAQTTSFFDPVEQRRLLKFLRMPTRACCRPPASESV